MSIVGVIFLWFFAVVGFFAVVALVWGGFDAARHEAVTPAPPASTRPPLEVTNLHTIPRQPQVLQKTTLQITTTKYVDPNETPPKELTA